MRMDEWAIFYRNRLGDGWEPYGQPTSSLCEARKTLVIARSAHKYAMLVRLVDSDGRGLSAQASILEADGEVG